MLLISFAFSFGLNCKSTDFLPKRNKADLGILSHIQKMDDKPVRIAFLGDSGADSDSKFPDVLRMIKRWGTDAIVHLGDFDYNDDPASFEKVILDEVSEIPYLAAIGNHDLKKWDDYQKRLATYMNKHSIICDGEYGVKMVCNVKGINIVLSGVGTFGTDHEAYLDQQLSKMDGWKICGWHKNQHYFQTGHKTDEVGYAAYEICREHGAIIMTGHEHSYARTKVMKQFADQIIASNDKNSMIISPGNTFAIVTGLGGRSIRPWENNSEKWPWWASLLSESNNAEYGAVLCEFDDFQAKCVFKDINDNIRDTFNITRTVTSIKRKFPICKKMIDVVAHKSSGGSHLFSRTNSLNLAFDLSNIPLDKVYSVNLQLYLFKQPQDITTSISIESESFAIQYQEEVETGEVWNSRNIQNMLKSHELSLKIGFGSDYKIGNDDCFAPTLVLQIDDCAKMNK